jgi:hypothetical protein
MVQDDSYYLSLGYEYARQRKALDILNDEKQDLLALSIRIRRGNEETDRVIEQRKKARRLLKKAHYEFNIQCVCMLRFFQSYYLQ